MLSQWRPARRQGSEFGLTAAVDLREVWFRGVELIRSPAISLATSDFIAKSRLRALLDHFAVIEDPREPWRVAHPLAEVLLLVVCGTIADCEDYEGIAECGARPIWNFCAAFCPIIMAFPASVGSPHPDEPHRSVAVLASLHVLGAGDLARRPRPRRHRRQDLPSQSITDAGTD
jgi:hypothetical protein